MLAGSITESRPVVLMEKVTALDSLVFGLKGIFQLGIAEILSVCSETLRSSLRNRSSLGPGRSRAQRKQSSPHGFFFF
jgi:hypothetical protein